MWGQLRIIQGGIWKLGGTGKNSSMRGHTKFLGGLKNREGKAFRGPVHRGVLITTNFSALTAGRDVTDGLVLQFTLLSHVNV